MVDTPPQSDAAPAAPASAPAPSPAPSPALVRLEQQRQKLLDLTRRNRLLNFRATRRTTVRIVDEVPSELFRLVASAGRTMGFLPGAPKAPAEDPAAALAEAVGMERADLRPEVEAEVLELVDPAFARQARVVPLRLESELLVVALDEPQAPDAPERLQEVSHAVGREVRGAVATSEEIQAALGRYYPLPGFIPAKPALTDSRNYARVARDELDARHTDFDLQTELEAGELEANLTAIARAAASTLEEQGFNSLYLGLGFLEWEDRESEQRQQAPILLVPVRLERKNVRRPYKLVAGDDDPLVNPALAYKLKQDWGIELPELPEDLDEADPDAILADLAGKVVGQAGWRVSDECSLALYSFTKFVMYKDLELHGGLAQEHPLVRRLLGDPRPLPELAPPLERPPHEVFAVTDADASQREAVEAALRGESMVLEGPPGTGKSQTITNLIAEFLGAGKTVLFVSEKMAALSVVQERLQSVGLGEFCLELHSRHANKRALVKRLSATLELEPQPDHAEDAALATLAAEEAELQAYCQDLHTSHGPLEATPYQILGALQERAPLFDPVAGARLVAALSEAGAWTRQDLEAREQALAAYAEHLERVSPGQPPLEVLTGHPLRGVGLRDVDYAGQGELFGSLEALAGEALPALKRALDELCETVLAHPVDSLGAVEGLLDLAEILADPALPAPEVLANPAWDQVPPRAAALTSLAQEARAQRQGLAECFTEAAFEREDLTALAAVHQGYGEVWYRWFVPSYWSASSAVDTFRQPGYTAQGAALVADLGKAEKARTLAKQLADADAEGRALYGPAWDGDPAALARTGELAQRFRAHLKARRPRPELQQALAAGGVDTSRLQAGRAAARERLDALQAAWQRFQSAAAFDAVAGFGQSFEDTPLSEVLARLAEIQASPNLLADWTLLQRSLGTLHDLGLASFLGAIGGVAVPPPPAFAAPSPAAAPEPEEAAASEEAAPDSAPAASADPSPEAADDSAPEAAPAEEVPAEDVASAPSDSGANLAEAGPAALPEGVEVGALVPTKAYGEVLRQAFFRRWLDEVSSARPRLRGFDPVAQGERISEFRRLDARQLQLARVRLRHRLAALRPDTSWLASKDSELGLLQRELRRKRGHLPVRQLLRRVPTVLRALKPCMLMSPLTVAQFTDPALHAFDLVVFDEASQIAPEDSLGAILRGKQLVVVGDSKQMPPTSFFKKMVAQDTSDLDEEDLEPDLESVLDECVTRGLPQRVLRWHYRSRHESLIAFSNRHFYEGRLRTFPSPDDGGGRLGLSLEIVEGAVYQRGKTGTNPGEAESVADAVIEHYRRTPERSLGVGAFSQAQQEAILDAVEKRLRAEPHLETLLSAAEEEHFFVKNLENLQGDERDVIMISIGYGPDQEGKLSLNFGPLNKAGGERRLNVLVTRAREQVRVFSSFHPDDLDLRRTQAHGVHLLKHYLQLARLGQVASLDSAEEAPRVERATVSEGLAAVLRARGHEVELAVGGSSVKVDLAIKEGERYVLGILVDGESWAKLPTPRDRERVVPGVLSHQRWDLSQVFALDWHARPERVLAQLEDDLVAARTAQAERDAQAAAEAAALASGVALETPDAGQDEGSAEAIKLKAAPAPAATEIAPYVEFEVTAKGLPSAFPSYPDAELDALTLTVVAGEGPIHSDELQRRVLAHWELSRSGKKARTRIDDSVQRLVDSEEIALRGEFCWPISLVDAPLRDRSEAGPRGVELLPPEELTAALELVARKEFRIGREDLIKRSGKLLGFKRPGSKLKGALGSALDALVTGGSLVEERGIVTLPE